MRDLSNKPIDHIKHALLRQAWTTEGRFKAFEFAVKCEANIDLIQTELETEETGIQEMLANSAFGKNNSMAAGASPRIYRDGYISGLREAIHLIDELRSGSLQEVLSD